MICSGLKHCEFWEKKAHRSVQMKAVAWVRTQLGLQLAFDCVLLTLVTGDAAATYRSQARILVQKLFLCSVQ